MATWRQEEIAYLEENASVSVAEMARRLGRSEMAVKNKAHCLGVSLGRGGHEKWSDADRFCLKIFARHGDVAISQIVGRSVSAVRYQASMENISLRKGGDMIDTAEESAAVMEHDGGWPKLAAEAMSAACCYMFTGERFHRLAAKDYLRKNCEDLVPLYDDEDRLATQVKLAQKAFDVVGTIDDVRKIDSDLAFRFEQQVRLWGKAKDDEREEHAGGMTRGYLMLIERILKDG